MTDIEAAILNALGVSDQSATEPRQKLVTFLRDRKLLLVTDNCEHVLPALRVLVPLLLRGAPQIRVIAKALLKHHRPFLATRASPQVAALIKRIDRRAVYHEAARLVAIRDAKRRLQGQVLIITAGTSDIPVAEEARLTAEVMGSRVETLYDVGVAGIHRLLGRRKRLTEANVIVVVAGMDGVLPSVVGGLVDCPVVAVPTSRGYGASFNGLAALLTMLNSCAAGVGVMNIDNGFGAGCLAHRINALGEGSFAKRRS